VGKEFMNPERPPEPEEIETGEIEKTDYKEERKVWGSFDPRRIFLSILAIAMILSSLLWIGQGFGLIGAILPVGLITYEGWVWAGIGLIGMLLFIFVITGASYPRWWKNRKSDRSE
jgi:hypothetical protein